MSLQTLLSAPGRYRDQIDWLHLKYDNRHRLFDLQQDGIPLASISMNRSKVGRVLARTVGSGRYRLRPAKIRWLTDGKKQRLLYEFCLTDMIVHGVVASIINESMEPRLSPQLYSYRKGTHWWKAVSDFTSYVRAHRRAHRDLKSRGLYVLRRDIQQYTDSIPVGDRSELWDQLKAVLAFDPECSSLHQRYWSLIKHVIRPETYSHEGFLYQNIQGVPTGSPISTTLFNLYLVPLDKALERIPGGFYARYSDDILFAHLDQEVVREANRQLDGIIHGLGICTNKKKDRTLFFNGAGRPSPGWLDARGTTKINFLGCDVAFDGTVCLNKRKVRGLLRDVTARACRTLETLDDRTPENAGPVICAAINQALNPTSPCRQKSATLLRSVVTSRAQLKEIDYHIARIVARVLTGRADVRAFRQIAYRTIREQWQLISLVHLRNTGRGN